MITKIKGRVLTAGKIVDGAVYVENGVITAVGCEDLPFDVEQDFGDGYVMPGLIDVHTHGAIGFDYSEADADGVLSAVRHQVLCGATSVMPTVTSSTYEATYRALENIERAMLDPEIGGCIIGAHLEGPYFSQAQSGAQDKALITEPKKEDYMRLTERFGHIIKRWDFAPERDRGGEFCAYLKDHGILPSAGHTDAKYDDMLVAKEKGCSLITHLYSCTSTITREQGFRKLGVIECAYLWDDMYVEIIADGKHLPIELLRLIFKLKPLEKILLITDSMSVTGTKEARGQLGSLHYVIEDGVCKLLDRSAFAGSIATAERLLKVCAEAGLDRPDISRLGSENPATLFGLRKGRLQVGYDADIIIADGDLNVQGVFVRGEKQK